MTAERTKVVYLGSPLDEFARARSNEERAAARVFALCAAGRLDEGRAAAERFQKRYPGSLLTERVRQACEP